LSLRLSTEHYEALRTMATARNGSIRDTAHSLLTRAIEAAMPRPPGMDARRAWGTPKRPRPRMLKSKSHELAMGNRYRHRCCYDLDDLSSNHARPARAA